ANAKFIALHFLLKTECPVCLKHTREYAKRAGEVPGVVHLFLKPDEPDDLRKWVANLSKTPGSQPLVYRDPDATWARQLKVMDGYGFHGQTMHYPALILLDRGGAEVFRYVGKSNVDRCPFDKFAVKVAELSKSPVR
ncbi:MAG: redoxin domain-containing protein, partial [Tepidisphaeraceae bacterium]